MTVISARQFNQDVSAAKRAAVAGPVVITERGRPSYVLLSVEEFDRLRGPRHAIRDLLRMDVEGDLDLPPREIGAREAIEW